MLVSRPLFIHAYIYFSPRGWQVYPMWRSSRPPIALMRWLFLFLLTICSFCDPDAPS